MHDELLIIFLIVPLFYIIQSHIEKGNINKKLAPKNKGPQRIYIIKKELML